MATADTHPDNDPLGGEGGKGQEIWFYECVSTHCKLRFPAPLQADLVCPACKSPVERKIRSEVGNPHPAAINPACREVSVILDNLRSAYNVGSILRTSDGAGVKHAFLCGITPTPQHSRLAKTSLTAEIHTSWSYHPNSIDLIGELKSTGIWIVGLETSRDAIKIFSEIDQPDSPMAIVVGNEVCGIDPAVLELCDQKLYLPMTGIKESLNVAVSFGIAAYILNRRAFQEHPVKSDKS